MCDIGSLWLSSGCFQLTVVEYQIASRIASRALSRWMQGLEESDESSRLCRTQIVSIGGHVAAALNHLPDKLVLRQPHGNAVQRWSPLSARVAKRVAVAALLDLKHERALALECGRAMNVALGHRIAAPCTHMWTPGRELCHTSKRAESDRDQQHRNHRNGTALPAFFSFT